MKSSKYLENKLLIQSFVFDSYSSVSNKPALTPKNASIDNETF